MSSGQTTKIMDSKLWKSIMRGDCEGVKESLNNIEILRGVALQGNSAFHVAAARGTQEMMELSVRRIPCMLLMRNMDQETPLHTAARCGKLEVVQVLLNVDNVLQCNCNSPWCPQKIDLEASPIQVQEIWRAQDNNGETALHYAVKGDYMEVVKMLLTKVEGITSIVNNVGESPLYTTCYYNCLEIGKVLLLAGPAMRDTRDDGTSCLHETINNILEWIEEDYDYWHCHDNALKLALELVGERPHLAEAVDPSGNSPLHLLAALPFAEKSHLELLEKLLNAKPNMNFVLNKDDMAPIHIAARDGPTEVIRVLIDSAPHCSYLLGKNSKNALHFAFQRQDDIFGSVQFWLRNEHVDKGFLISKPDSEGKTALSIASEAFDNPGITNWILRVMLRSSPPGPNIFKKSKASNSSQQDFEKPVANKSKKEVDDKDPKERLSVIAALIATITFAAGFTIPGGFSEAKGSLVLMHEAALKAFILFDSVALSLSIMSLLALIYRPSVGLTGLHNLFYKLLAEDGRKFRKKSKQKSEGRMLKVQFRKRYERKLAQRGRLYLLWSLYATMVAFGLGLYVVLASKYLWLAITVCVITFWGLLVESILPSLIDLTSWLISQARKRKREKKEVQ